MLLGLKGGDSGLPRLVAVPLCGTASGRESVASCFFTPCQDCTCLIWDLAPVYAKLSQ